MRSNSVLVVAALLVGCGQGLNGFSLQSPPAVEVRAKVDLEALRAAGHDGPLLVSIDWVRANRAFEGACARYGEFPEVVALCGDPFAVRFAFDTVMKPLVVDADGVGSIVLDALPKAEASYGDRVGRVAYGSVIVALDVDHDGTFAPWPNEEGEMDRLVGASFLSLLKPQQRLVLREGGWNPLSFFYPLLGCDSPPPIGFSRVVATLDLSGERPDGECEITGVDVPIEVAPVSEAEAEALACPSFVGIGDPEYFTPDPAATGTCLSDSIYLETREEGACRYGTIVPLAGCWDDRDECETPQWDHTKAPPAWWSCP